VAIVTDPYGRILLDRTDNMNVIIRKALVIFIPVFCILLRKKYKYI
jgi:hypothetical protein